MKTAFLPVLLLLFASYSLTAQQAFGFKYQIDTHYNDVGQLYEYIETDSLVAKKTGYILMNGDTTPIYKTVPYVKCIPRKINGVILGSLELNETKDTLTIKPWFADSINTILTDTLKNTVSLDTDNEYKLAIKTWDLTCRDYPFINPKFSFWQFTATSIPFRANFKTGNIQAEFLNANISFFRMWGQTRIYKSEFVKSKNIVNGFGVYIGASTTGEEGSKNFGLNYGLNGLFSIYGFNMILAVGSETGFDSRKNRFNPYFGFGVGFKLVEFFDASAEKE